MKVLRRPPGRRRRPPATGGGPLPAAVEGDEFLLTLILISCTDFFKLFNSKKGCLNGGHPAAGGGPTPGRRRGGSLGNSSKFFFSFSFDSNLLFSKVYDFPRRSSRSDDVCSLSSSERMTDMLINPPMRCSTWRGNDLTKLNRPVQLWVCPRFEPPTPHLCMICLLYTSPSPRDKRQSRMPSSA